MPLVKSNGQKRLPGEAALTPLSWMSVWDCGDGGDNINRRGIFDVPPLSPFSTNISLNNVQEEHIPYKSISGLKVVKDEIKEALKVVCKSHNIALAQAWTTSEDNKSKRLFASKLTGYLYAEDGDNYLDEYIRLCDLTPCRNQSELPLETLQDYKSRYISNFYPDMMDDEAADIFHGSNAFVICLRDIDTGDFDYAFEFIWVKHSNLVTFLEKLLLKLKICLPRFKFASGVDLGDELDVIVDETQSIKIFQGKKSSSMSKAQEEEKKPMLVDYIARSEVMCKTTPKVLPREVIKKQFGKTMKEAAKDLNVSLSTLKRKFKELGIPEWPGPNFLKRNTKDSSIIQINTHEHEDDNDGAVQNPSTVNLNKNTLTLKVEYEDDMIKFHVPISQETFVTVEKEIDIRLKLSAGTYKLKYVDEDGDWISLSSEEEMRDCIKSSKKSVARLRVLPKSRPSSSSRIAST